MIKKPRTVAAALTLLLGACAEAPAPPPPQPPAVDVAVPEVRDVQGAMEFPGRTAPRESVEIRARVPGQLREMHFSPATLVRRGQLLFTIEPEPYVADRDQANAAIASAEAELARAESDLQRLNQAVQTNAVSLQEVDRARAQRDQAQAALMSAQAALVQAEINLGYTTVTSPLTGLISRNLVDVGNLVGSGSATLLATINRIDPIFAYWEMSERLLLQIFRERNAEGGARFQRALAEGEVPVFLGLEGEEGWPHEGWIDYLDNTVDPGTGTIQVRGVFRNAAGGIFPGLFARVRVPTEVQPAAVLVPERAIGTDLGGKYLYVLGPDNIVEQRYVQLGQLEGLLRVITSGLRDGELFIVAGLQRARPGLPVTPTTVSVGN